MQIDVTPQKAFQLIHNNPSIRCQSGLRRYWEVGSNGVAKAQSVLWLFCWAKASESASASWSQAGYAAIKAFDMIFYPISFKALAQCLDLDWARANRYNLGDIESALNSYLLQ